MGSLNVICFSGGMDSTAVLLKENFDTILFFKTGTEDNERELEIVKSLLNLDLLKRYKDKLKIIDVSFMKDIELENKIVPHRNSIFALIASNFGSNIYFGFTAGDTTKDKDYVFKSQIEGLLNYFGLDKHKVNNVGYPYRIVMPFKDYTKSDIVKYYKDKGEEYVKILAISRSCYSGIDGECGNCKSCFRKYQAFKSNNLEHLLSFEINRENFEKYLKEYAGKRGREL